MSLYIGAVWIGRLRLQVCVFWLFFFFFSQCVNNNITWMHSAGDKIHCSHIVHRSHSTIHTLKNYFTIVFSVFSFTKNKLYPTDPLYTHFSKHLISHITLKYQVFLIFCNCFSFFIHNNHHPLSSFILRIRKEKIKN